MLPAIESYKNSFDLDVVKGKNPYDSTPYGKPFGYITKLTFGGFCLEPNVVVPHPLDPEHTYRVIGVLSRLSLNESNLKEVVFKVKVLEENLFLSNKVGYKENITVYTVSQGYIPFYESAYESAEIEFEVFSYDSIAKKYFKCLYTRDTLYGMHFKIHKGFVDDLRMQSKIDGKITEKKFYTLTFSFFEREDGIQEEIHWAKNCNELIASRYSPATIFDIVQKLEYSANKEELEENRSSEAF